jgi:hypothetical protein
MLRWIRFVVLATGLAGFAVYFGSWNQYVRGGGIPDRPWFSQQRTQRERQLARRSRLGGVIFAASVLVLVLLDLWEE